MKSLYGTLFATMLLYVRSHPCIPPLECSQIVERALPVETPQYKRTVLVNGTCGDRWTNANTFCQKLALGTSFLDVHFDPKKLPLGLCPETKSWLVENVYVLRI